MSGDHDDLVAELARLAEIIDERALTALREAVASGEGKRPDSDRYLTQARRALEKAMQALERAGGNTRGSVDDD